MSSLQCRGVRAIRSRASGLANRSVPTKQTGVDTARCRHTCHASAVDTRGEHPPAERILRYPDGAVRTIRYPELADNDDDARYVDVDEAVDDESWGVCREGDAVCQNAFSAATDDPLPGAAPHGLLWADELRSMLDAAAADPRSSSGAGVSSSALSPAAPRSKRLELPSSPAELLKFLQSPEYKQQQAELEMQVRTSFAVLTGCPWLHPKPVYVLAMRAPGQDHATTYTLPTRSVDAGQAAELARIVANPLLADSLSVERIQDGVVCFEDDDEAADFRDMLEADGGADVMVSQVDSHALFRMATSVDAVVVLMGQGDATPRPHQLAACLRGRGAMDDM